NTFCKTPQEIIINQGESVFRQKEREVVKKIAKLRDYVIATGGGVCLNGDNVVDLKANGIVILINRDLNLLNCDNRPISKTEGIKELYARRKSIYENAKDFTVENNSTVSDAVESVEKIYENFSN
ncbi:MAG TPA: shikimate dehydrogenase, partial [Clostridiales bacterium]|nr:shikimate dehydrogenase [Clostridiales bacterium]